MTQYNPHFFPIPLCANRSSTYLFISVCFTGSEEPQQGENVKFHQHMVMFLIKMCDGIFFIVFFAVCASSLQTHRAVPHNSISTQNDEPSSQGNRTRRRRRRHHRQTPPSSQPQSPVQHILNPANLLRRLLPSSSLFNSGANAS